MCQFVPNFLSCVYVKYDLNRFTNWESYHKNKKGELFVETQCICDIKAVLMNTISSFAFLSFCHAFALKHFPLKLIS